VGSESPHAYLEKLRRDYSYIRWDIRQRLQEFQNVDRRDGAKLFEELVFCVLTPQSSAKRAHHAVGELAARGLLRGGRASDVYEVLRRAGIRFPAQKARYIVLNRKALASGDCIPALLEEDPRSTRERLVGTVWGFGYKEASHFLRNIGYRGLAIIDRHVMRGLIKLGILHQYTPLTSRRRYLFAEERFMEAAALVGVEPEELDLLFWYEGTGEIFK